MPGKTLVIDCDTGIDDALALLYLLADPDVEICGITTVFGNTTAPIAARNTLRVLALVDRTDIPVAVGAAATLTGRAPATSPHVHGADGLGEYAGQPPVTAPQREPAAQFIARMARTQPGELHLLATGPLTNLAHALHLEPELPDLIDGVTIMGGAAAVPGNVTASAEANIFHDPDAAAVVFAAGWDVTLVPLDVTMTELITEDLVQHLAESGSAVAEFASAILGHYLDFYQRTVFGYRAAACHDPLAAAIAVGDVAPLLAPRVRVAVETGNGPSRGATIADLRGRYQGYPDQDGATARVVLETGGDFGKQLVDRLCRVDGNGAS